MSGRVLRRLGVSDLDALWALELRAHPLGWSEEALLVELVHDDATVIGAFDVDTLAAYIAVRDIVDERWVLNIATAPEQRRRGHGRALLDAAALLDRSTGHEPKALWLEVRASNAPARALYAAQGFVEVGTRRGYYPCPDGSREAAVLMRRGTPAESR